LSTILKALKRVDQTTPPPEDLQSWPPRIDTKKAVKGRLYRIWLYRKVVLALLVAVIVITAGLLVYSQKHLLLSKIGSQNRSEKPPVFQSKIEPPARQADRPVPQQAISLNRQKTSSRVKSGRDSASAEQPSAELRRRPLGQKNKPTRMTTSTPQTRAPETTPSGKSGISRKPVATAKSSGQRKTRPPTIAPAKKSRAVRSYQRLENSKLKLQAIAWSNDAAQRIAVINDRIVREGESVEGFSINQIRQEDVIVNDGSQSWQLEFRLR